jgi:hypothetical protein
MSITRVRWIEIREAMSRRESRRRGKRVVRIRMRMVRLSRMSGKIRMEMEKQMKMEALQKRWRDLVHHPNRSELRVRGWIVLWLDKLTNPEASSLKYKPVKSKSTSRLLQPLSCSARAHFDPNAGRRTSFVFCCCLYLVRDGVRNSYRRQKSQ